MKRLVAMMIAACWVVSCRSEAAPAKPAELKISGYGILGDRRLKKMLTTIELAGKKPEFFTANFIEDSSLLLLSSIRRDGYLQPVLRAQVMLADNRRLELNLNNVIENPLPRPMRIRRAHFKVHKGVLYHYRALDFQGLESVRENKARAYFEETGILLSLKSTRIYTPERLDRSLANLKEVLERQGYREARVVVSDLHRDDKTGAVDATISVQQGAQSIVRSVRKEYFYEGKTNVSEIETVFPHKPYSKFWEQDFVQGVKSNNYRLGYPDTSVTLSSLKQEPAGKTIQWDLLATVRSGPRVTLGGVAFEGEKKTKVSVMRETVDLKPGGLLDRIKVERGQARLLELGVFETVGLRYEPVNADTRDVIYQVKEGKRLDVSLLFGFGSYELLRGGVDIEQRNLWGRAHHAHLRAIQSFKASSGEFTYTIPQAMGEYVDVFLNGSGLRRQEVTFLREEYGGGLGTHVYLRDIRTHLTSRYSYQVLNAADLQGPVVSEGVVHPGVGSVITDIRHEQLDHPLYPQRGYRVGGNFETATRYFGGDVNYERIDVDGSFHHPLGGGRVLHLGISHGVAVSFGSPSANLPFNRRFFPGGQNSIRGYQVEEASPRNAIGQLVGAETYVLGSVEFEQAITPKWSVVVFSDNLGEARRLADYPAREGLFSAGAGLRWRTIVGPVRLEYGRNINPRPGDPSGTVQFSLGFPF